MTEKIQETEIKKTRLRLSERLKLVASFVPEGSRIADIGTDHGYVPIYLAEIGKIKSALAMDVRKGPLARADEHIEEYRHDVGDAAISIETRLSNGLEKLQAKEADTVIIAGMGGELEISILEAGKQLWSSIRHWIFSPQSDLEKFRRYLKENGFFIENEAMILDEGKFYTVIKAGFGTNEKDACVCKTLLEYRFGAVLIKRRDAVLKQYLLKEEIPFGRQNIPTDKQGQENLLRSLMNVRPPRPISNDFLKIQDEYLTERNIERGITDVDTLAPVKSDSRLYIWQGDITTLKCDAIVNACNSQMLGCFSPMHACIDNFIHTYAGMELRLKMHEIMTKQGHEEETGKAKITSGYNLPTKYILHTVGPIIQWKVTKEDEDLLAGCYTECLKLAADTGVESIAFCCLSTGVFHFPQQRAAEIATNTVKQYLNKDSRIKKVIFNVFKDEDLKIYSGLL